MFEATNISKSFDGVPALSDVSWHIRPGEVHALLGENGAGKSTLIKVLAGVHRADTGTMRFEGADFKPKSPLDAFQHGISTVYQEVNLIPTLSVAENIFLGRRPTRAGFPSRRAMRQGAREALRPLGLDIDIDKELGAYPISIQQIVAVSRAMHAEARLLILDEPTSSLDNDEVRRLFSVIRTLRDRGMAIIFVSHFLDQVFAISDRMTVLRNGKVVASGATSEISRLELIAIMMGRSIGEVEGLLQRHESAPQPAQDTALLEVDGLARTGTMGPVNFNLRKGEIVGLAGLLGSGRTETARMLFGVDPATEGTLSFDGQLRTINSPRDAIQLGIAMNPEDRRTEGCFPDLTLRENLFIARQAKLGVLRRIPKAQLKTFTNEAMHSLQIVAVDSEQPMGQLSGGNQQKALLARWLLLHPKLFILDEPTRGIDVGSKAEVERLLARLRDEGMSLLFISSELEEVVRNVDRAVVLRDREQVGLLEGDEISEGAIMHLLADETDA